VRVPAFVISPYISEGHVCHETFDHTSVLKTILVHNRDRIPKSMFTLFGDRVNQMPHLGAALDRDEPREWPYMDAIPPHHHFFNIPPMDLEPLTSSQPRTTDGEAAAPRHGRTIPGDAVSVTQLQPPPPLVVRRTSNIEQPADRGEFHSGLRDMFRPRK